VSQAANLYMYLAYIHVLMHEKMQYEGLIMPLDAEQELIKLNNG